MQPSKQRVVVPTNESWDDFFQSQGVDLGDRDQPVAQTGDKADADSNDGQAAKPNH